MFLKSRIGAILIKLGSHYVHHYNQINLPHKQLIQSKASGEDVKERQGSFMKIKLYHENKWFEQRIGPLYLTGYLHIVS